MAEPTFQSNVATVQQRRTDPSELPMGLSFGNTGRIDQHTLGPLGIDVDNNGTVDLVVTPEELRQFVLERGHRVSQADGRAAAGAVPASSPQLAGSAGVPRVIQSARSAISFGGGNPEEFGSTRIPSSSTRLAARPATVVGEATRPAALDYLPPGPARVASPSPASRMIGSSSSLASMPVSAGVLPQRVLTPTGSLPRSQPRSPVPPLVLPGAQSQRSSLGPSPPPRAVSPRGAGTSPPRSGGRGGQWKWAPGPPGSGQRPPSTRESLRPSITSRPRSTSPIPGYASSPARSATPPGGPRPRTPSVPRGGSTRGGAAPPGHYSQALPQEPLGAPQFPATSTFPADQPPPFSGALRRADLAPRTGESVYPPGQQPLQGGVQYAGPAGVPRTSDPLYPPDQPSLQGGQRTGLADYAPVLRTAASTDSPDMPSMPGSMQYAYATPADHVPGPLGPPIQHGSTQYAAPRTAEPVYPPDQPPLQGGQRTAQADYAPVLRPAASAYPPEQPPMPGSTQYAYATPASYATRPPPPSGVGPGPAAPQPAATPPLAARGRGPDRATSVRTATPGSVHSPPTPPMAGLVHDGPPQPALVTEELRTGGLEGPAQARLVQPGQRGHGLGVPHIIPPMNQVHARVGAWLGAKPRSVGPLPPGPPESMNPADEPLQGGVQSGQPADYDPRIHTPVYAPGQPAGQPPLQGGSQQGQPANYDPRIATPVYAPGQPAGQPPLQGGIRQGQPADYDPRIGAPVDAPSQPAGQPPLQGGTQGPPADYDPRTGTPVQAPGQSMPPDYAPCRAAPFPPAWPSAGVFTGSATTGGQDYRPPASGPPADPGGPADPQMAVHYQQVHQQVHHQASGTQVQSQPPLVSGYVSYGNVQGSDTHIMQQSFNATQNYNATQNVDTRLSTQSFNATQNYNMTQNPQTTQPPASVVDRPVVTDRVTVVERPVDRIVEKIVEVPVYVKETQPIYMTQPIEKVVLKQPVNVVKRRIQAYEIEGDFEFPYHDPMPELGCDFVGHVLPATNWNALLDGR